MSASARRLATSISGCGEFSLAAGWSPANSTARAVFICKPSKTSRRKRLRF